MTYLNGRPRDGVYHHPYMNPDLPTGPLKTEIIDAVFVEDMHLKLPSRCIGTSTGFAPQTTAKSQRKTPRRGVYKRCACYKRDARVSDSISAARLLKSLDHSMKELRVQNPLHYSSSEPGVDWPADFTNFLLHDSRIDVNQRDAERYFTRSPNSAVSFDA